jgi:hypothetical protein
VELSQDRPVGAFRPEHQDALRRAEAQRTVVGTCCDRHAQHSQPTLAQPARGGAGEAREIRAWTCVALERLLDPDGSPGELVLVLLVAVTPDLTGVAGPLGLGLGPAQRPVRALEH